MSADIRGSAGNDGPVVTIEVAGVVIGLVLPDPTWAAVLRTRYAAFVTADDARWRVTVRHEPELAPAEPGWARHEAALTRFHVHAYRGEIDLAAGTAWVTAPALARLPSAVERTLAFILMQALPREHRALLLHACGVIYRGRGYAFFGPSGAGKTTVAQLAAGYGEVLSDENVVLRLAAHGVELVSTPFWGTSTPAELVRRTRRSLPLAGLFQLAHGPTHQLTALTPAHGIAALLQSEKVATERVESALAWLDVAGQIAGRVPVQTLTFPPTAELWSFLLRHESDTAAPKADIIAPEA